jgi:hypothetical protein
VLAFNLVHFHRLDYLLLVCPVPFLKSTKEFAGKEMKMCSEKMLASEAIN